MLSPLPTDHLGHLANKSLAQRTLLYPQEHPAKGLTSKRFFLEQYLAVNTLEIRESWLENNLQANFASKS